MMDGREFDLYFHHLRFENECLRRTGTEFQTFFEDILSRAQPTFVIVKPWGREGDRKCDGLVSATGTLFQVYAPEQLKTPETVAKIKSDFAGALDGWPEMKRWIFVWSAHNQGLPPAIVACLEALRREQKTVEVIDWGREQLWRVVADELTQEQRVSLLGAVPRTESANRTTAAEIQVVLEFVAHKPVGPDPDDSFDLTDLKPKLEKNRLSAEIGRLAGRALPLAREVERYVNGSYESDLNKRVGSRLIARYRELTELGTRGDAAFIALIDFARGDPGGPEEMFWSAAGIVTYYFEICDIFER
jgi:hypothetical protein